jgi:LmbE family N-acetylglucosaminyl deacetylase
MDKQRFIFLSPHYDDAALSCGGLIWDLTRQGHQVEIWTLMGGFPPDENLSKFAQENHLRWGLSGEAAIRMRRAEDRAACQVLGATPCHFDWPDAIYRRDPETGEPLVNNNKDLFGKSPESSLVRAIRSMLEEKLSQDALVVFPMGLGHHIDHLAAYHAGESFADQKIYFSDYPYVLKVFDAQIQPIVALKKQPHALDEKALTHWQDAVLCYKSQLNDFWRDEQEMRLALRNYQAGGGGRLWQNPHLSAPI